MGVPQSDVNGSQHPDRFIGITHEPGFADFAVLYRTQSSCAWLIEVKPRDSNCGALIIDLPIDTFNGAGHPEETTGFFHGLLPKITVIGRKPS
jgi:hypothetical protein